jgi:serine/threonine protein kinase
MEDLTGRQLGSYRIVAPLGEGGMAAVYKAYQPAMDRYVAVKVLPRRLAGDPQFTARFQREAKILAKLLHPNILQVFDYGQAEGFSYIVMPLVPGGTLKDSLVGKPLPLSRVLKIMTQIASALDFAHARKIVHRDVKPSNILIDESDNCLLTDFGLARMLEPVHQITATGVGIGTPDYMSPEQGLGERLDNRSDIYSLGVVLYELLTGQVPYHAETPMAVILKHIHDPLPIPRSVNPAIPESVELVVLKAMAKAPRERFQTAGELLSALSHAMRDLPDATPRSGTHEVARLGSSASVGTLSAHARRQLRRLLPVGAAVVVLLGGLILIQQVPGVRQSTTQATWPVPNSMQPAQAAPNTEVAAPVGQINGQVALPAGLQSYDNFDDPVFDTGFNPALWQPYGDDPKGPYQGNGLLVVQQTGRPKEGTALAARRYFDFVPSSTFAFEAKALLDPDHHPNTQE